MIDKILETIREEIQNFFENKIGVTGSEDKIILSPLGSVQDKSPSEENYVKMCLIRIENDLENMSTLNRPVTGKDRVTYYNKPIKLNLYVFFAASFKNYTESLKFISYIISFFQSKKVFTSVNTPGLKTDEKIRMDLYNQTVEDQNQLWGMTGGNFCPSVMYKLRMVLIDEQQIQSMGASSKDLNLNTGDKK